MSLSHQMCRELNHLLRKEALWNWTKECESAFCELKSAVRSEMLLKHYDSTSPIIVVSGVASHGVGAVMTHLFTDGKEKAVL
ncbi:unnamed protein product [Schistosoma curassoni]|uniref:RT_RNaseH_2 domain-containing protein n=1 Tax=Schistosoma curassoni TaxID=6186 RepID=A0A183L0D5_9TREM|nr:unnamed protein product [Schistosoma curassoni]